MISTIKNLFKPKDFRTMPVYRKAMRTPKATLKEVRELALSNYLASPTKKGRETLRALNVALTIKNS